MHSLFGLAGLLGLVALAFGKPAVARVAQIVLIGPPVLIAAAYAARWLHLHGYGFDLPF